ncbi:MAG: Type 1 glutamine amidotransferase-like domain-containing protein [Candidatus Paceibacterota bacterium]|jgi:dipeptidase E
MKLLLTSSGLTNKSIAAALLELVGKPAGETNVAFIPTAADAEEDDKSWFINDLVNIKNQGFKQIDLVDIAALPKESWLPRFEHADILFFSGGHTRHLMHWLHKSGLAGILPELLKTRVYAGISAGSLVTGPTLALSSSTDVPFDYDDDVSYDGKGLHLVDFHIRPHFNSPDFPKASAEYLKEKAKEVPETIYCLDDQSALKIVDGNVEIVSEGETLVLNR